jgi:hypothetical protein
MLLRKLRSPGRQDELKTGDMAEERYEANYKHGGDSWIDYKAKLGARS